MTKRELKTRLFNFIIIFICNKSVAYFMHFKFKSSKIELFSRNFTCCLQYNYDQVGDRNLTVANIYYEARNIFAKIVLFFAFLVSYRSRLIFGSIIEAATLGILIYPLVRFYVM